MTPMEFWEFAVRVASGPAQDGDNERRWVSSCDPQIGVVTVIHCDKFEPARSNGSLEEYWQTALLTVEMDGATAGIICNDFDHDDPDAWTFHWTKEPSTAFCVEMVLRFGDVMEDDNFD